jgi:hypothetical protein
MFGLTDKVLAMVFGGLSALLLAACAVLYIEANGFFWIDGLKDKLEDCERDKKELRSERDSLIAAAKEAERLNKEQVQRIVSEQEKINGDIETRYRADRERMQRELADRLRRQTHNGNTQGTGTGSNGKAPGGSDEAAPVCIPPSQYVQGAETELQLDTLIDWVEQLLQVKR